MRQEARRAIFLDRDGVINALVYRPEEGVYDSPYSLEELRLLPGAAEAIRQINALGWLAVVVSNQPGVAKGKCDHAFLDQVTDKMREELARQGAHLDGVYYCRHHPKAVVAELRVACECRKPRPGLLLEAARAHGVDLAASYMVGDKLSDVEAGRAAGCKTILVGGALDRQGGTGGPRPDWLAGDLLEAVGVIQVQEGRGGDLHRLGEPVGDQAVAGVRCS